MKRIVLVILCLLLFGTGLFAKERNWGLNFGSGCSIYGAYHSSIEMGAGLFFGINKFLELNFGVIFPIQNIEYDVRGPHDRETEYTTGLGLQFGVYGKYPFSLNRFFVLYPIVGAELDYNYFGAWSAVHVRFGGGLDLFPLTRNMFIRFQGFFGPSFPFDGLGDNIGFGFFFRLGMGWML